MTEPLLPLLFDRHVATCEVALSSPLGELYPAEAEALHRARPRRLLEFRAGRHCARIALQRLGISAGALIPSEHRLPNWPPGVVGNISHTGDVDNGWCGAAVARSDGATGLGLDAELAVPLEPELWTKVLRPEEADFILTKAPADRGLLAKLFFCAKEATYKCQFPLSRKFLEFHDVSVVFDERARRFAATVECDAPPFPAGSRLNGRFLRTPELLAAAVLLEARNSALTTTPDFAR